MTFSSACVSSPKCAQKVLVVTENINKSKTTAIKARYKSEIEFDQDLKRFLEDKLVLSEYELEIALKTKILIDTVFHPRMPGKFYFHLSPTECDLVIYKRLWGRQTEMWSEIKKRFLEIIEFYRFGKNEIVMPIIIIETKNEDMTSHDLLLYSAKADKIKNIFPFVKYFLVCNHTTKLELTLARHGKYFDGIYILHREQEGVRQLTGNLDRVIKDIQQHIQNLIDERMLK